MERFSREVENLCEKRCSVQRSDFVVRNVVGLVYKINANFNMSGAESSISIAIRKDSCGEFLPPSATLVW
jgi:hypothetical protein